MEGSVQRKWSRHMQSFLWPKNLGGYYGYLPISDQVEMMRASGVIFTEFSYYFRNQNEVLSRLGLRCATVYHLYVLRELFHHYDQYPHSVHGVFLQHMTQIRTYFNVRHQKMIAHFLKKYVFDERFDSEFRIRLLQTAVRFGARFSISEMYGLKTLHRQQALEWLRMFYVTQQDEHLFNVAVFSVRRWLLTRNVAITADELVWFLELHMEVYGHSAIVQEIVDGLRVLSAERLLLTYQKEDK